MKRNAAGIAYEQLPEMSGFVIPLWLVNFTKNMTKNCLFIQISALPICVYSNQYMQKIVHNSHKATMLSLHSGFVGTSTHDTLLQ